MNAFLAFLGMAAYGKHQQATAARSLRQLERLQQLRQQAAQLHDALHQLELDEITRPGTHSAAQLRAARQRAERAELQLSQAEQD
ncbi:MAG: hypothetical protein JSR74_12480 [Proteobacteria bacterium]|nr:hypothetical protein [Pseudomonadota bacterium]